MKLARTAFTLAILAVLTAAAWHVRVVRAQATSCVGYTGAVSSQCQLTASATDPEGDQIYYVFSWGDGTADTRMPGSGFVASGTAQTATHTWNTAGSFTVRVYAYDEANHQSVSSDPVLVNIASLTLSTSLTSTSHGAAVWTNDAGFDYTTFCQAASGYSLSFCRTQVSENNGTWANVPGGNPSTTGMGNITYSGTYTMATAGSGYRFRSRADDTDSGSTTVTSTLIPSSGQIQFDNQNPVALASSPLANQSGPFSVSVTLEDYPNPGTGPNSGVTTWDVQYSTNGGTNWSNCKLGVSYLTTSFTFGSGCDSPVTLQPDTTYCFQARARDGVTHPSSPNQGGYFFNSGTMCTPYQVGSPPIAPNTPSPATGSVAAASTGLTWKGGDPDTGDVLTYRVYISQPNQALSVPADLDGTITNQLPDPNATVNYGPPQNRTFVAGQVYQWQVAAVDSTSKTTSGPVWTFTVNTLPTIISADISPNPVDRIGTITWSVSDPNATQSLSFGLYYGPVQGSTTGATSIASGLSPAAYCTGAPNNWNCAFDWDASCTLEAAGQYVVVTVNDGAQTATGGDTDTFAIVHTRTLYYPGPNDTTYATADDGDSATFPIESGSIETSSAYIRFRGACSTTDNPSADANAAGNPATYGGSLSPGVNSPDITLNDLLPGVDNAVGFAVEGCGTTQYRIRYNLVTACGQPYVGVEEGSIYSGGNIRATYSPPEGSFNATYLILGGGTSAQPRVIENFIAEPGPPGLTTVNPTFGQILYPQASESQQPQVGAFDYYGLTHRLSGSEVQDGQTNSYGHTVQVTTGNATLNGVLGGNSAELGGQVYYVKGNLTVDQPAQFLNAAAASGSGAGLFVVDGNLTIQSDITYQAAPISGSAIRTLASAGWLVRGNVTVAGGVGQIVGAFYVAGTSSGGGSFNSGSSPTQLNVFGAVIAKQLLLNRTYSAAGQPSERVVADGRILLNTPPGFANILQSLPTWQFRTP